MPADISSTTIEFHRFEDGSRVLGKGNKYIRTLGYQRAATEVVVRIEPKEFRRSLNQLRYSFNRTPESEAEAERLLGAEAGYFLDESQVLPEGEAVLRQLDIVTHASELRAYPFEAIYANASDAYLASPASGMILTRRIRSEFSYAVPPWPEVPSVLFVHAQLDHDFAQDLIDAHRLALSDALAPWGNAKDLENRKLLFVRMVNSAEELVEARKLADFSYVHILAHGAKVAEEDIDESDTEWGLRLGRIDTAAVSPEALADALKSVDGLPLVVTLAACDSGAADRPELGNSSLVETLHRSGIPVVVGSQFPLTMLGSGTLTREFYGSVLRGEDVRLALHKARVALRQEARQVDERRHDWLSLVGYVRLPPEGYSQYLSAFGLRVQLRLLEAARKDAEPLFAEPPPPRDEFARIEDRLRQRIGELECRKKELSGKQGMDLQGEDRELQAECAGLLASANKSLAEVYFIQARRCPKASDDFEGRSRKALDDSLTWYSEVYRRDLSKHWHGIQKLALEAALTGRIADPTELLFVQRVAKNTCEVNEKEYWGCGTLAEAILLAALAPEGFDLASARVALDVLCKRSAGDSKDRGFAAKSTRRQLERYVTWWTKENGYFPGRESDLKAYAQAMVECLPV